jgi:GT2 family glycosyltransferase
MASLASIVVVAHGKRAVTERCLATLEDALGAKLGGELELVLVDNASADDTLELFERWRERARVVALPDNRNFAGGCNAGAHAATGDVVVFLNNDTVVEPGALEALADQAREPGVGAAGLRLLYPDGCIQHAGVGMVRMPSGKVVPHHLLHYLPGDLPPARLSFDLDVVTAACMAVPRSVFEELGGFDEGYANGWEDVDLCLRLRVAGHRVVYRGDLWLTHDEGRTRGSVKGGDRNAVRFYARWEELIDEDSDLLGELLDGRIAPLVRCPQTPEPDGSQVVIGGQVSGIGSEADEARALLAVLEAAGVAPAARDVPMAYVSPRLSDEGWAPLLAARGRAFHPAALPVLVPVAGSPPVPELGAGAVARLSALPPAGSLPADVAAVWAASPALAEALVTAGVPRGRVEWLPPAVTASAHGAGGEGVLALLPAHDLACAADVLDGLTRLGSTPVRLLPSARTRELSALVAERLPGAELLAPCSDEARFAAIAARADAVACADPDDRLDRRALVAAGAGAAVVINRAEGPAATILGEQAVVVADRRARALATGLEAALDRAAAREERSSLVEAACGPAAIADRLRSLLAAASNARAGDAAAQLTPAA